MRKQIISLVCLAVCSVFAADACTSAIIGADVNPYGRPLLWKHRDTSNVDNKVEYVAPTDGSFGYTGLFNASDIELRECWTGFNSEGFAIMNTASYNLKDDKVPEKDMDREGYVMTMALRTCRTVDDFQKLLEGLPRPMGVEANFGVIDATGAGAYFETNNDSFRRINLSDAPDHVLVRTNYSHTGRKNEGFGYIREENTLHLLDPYVKNHTLTPEVLTENVSRSFYHSLWDKDMAEGTDPGWLVDQDFIPRYKSCATIVIEGCVPDSTLFAPVETKGKKAVKKAKSAIDIEMGPGAEYVMWTALGYPPVADIYPVVTGRYGVDPDLRGLEKDGHSKASDRSKARRDEVFPRHFDNGDRYIDLSKLRNELGTGYLQIIPQQNLEIYSIFRSMTPPSMP